MHIAIIGAGRVGGTLGRRFAETGHDVTFGVRDLDAESNAELRGERREVALVSDAASNAEVVLFATPWAATESAIASAGDLSGKVVIDATNPIGPGFVLTHGHTDSGAEQVARWAEGAAVAKVFNTTGFGNMQNPSAGEVKSAMFVAGDDEGAVDAAMRLAGDIGFDTYHLGGLKTARYLEPFAMVWITMSMKIGREFVLALVKRES